MPELPEVETIRRELDASLSGRRIQRIEVIDPTVLMGHRIHLNGHLSRAQKRLQATRRERIERVERLGKFLLFKLSSGESLVISLRMTGQLILADPQEGARVRFFYDHERRALHFFDRRRLGEMKIMSVQELDSFRQRMGPDALGEWVTPDGTMIFGKRRTAVHAALLNQNLISGVGNIYATEALFRAKIRPQRKAGSLKAREMGKLERELKAVLELGIRHNGCTFDSYRDIFNKPGHAQNYLRAYGRKDKPCVDCRGELRSVKISGRGVTYCSKCQH